MNYDALYSDILENCTFRPLPVDGSEWTNRAGRVCAISGQSNWGGNNSVRQIICWGADGRRKAFPVPWTPSDIAEIRRLIAE